MASEGAVQARRNIYCRFDMIWKNGEKYQNLGRLETLVRVREIQGQINEIGIIYLFSGFCSN